MRDSVLQILFKFSKGHYDSTKMVDVSSNHFRIGSLYDINSRCVLNFPRGIGTLREFSSVQEGVNKP